LLAHAFVSGFSGVMFAAFAEFLGWAPQARSMAAGVGGFMGAKAVEYVADRLLARSSAPPKGNDPDGSKTAAKARQPRRKVSMRKVRGRTRASTED
jgi:hypothetical protein